MVTPWIVLALLASSSTADTPTPAPPPLASPPSPLLADCRVLVDAGALDDAAACYRRVAATQPAHAALASALVDVVAGARLAPPTLRPAAPSPGVGAPRAPSRSASGVSGLRLSWESLAWRGRGEFVGAAALNGGAAALVGLAALTSSPPGPLVFAVPVAGGIAAAAAATAAVVVFDDVPDGDLHLVRSALWLGAFEALCIAGASTTTSVSGQLAALGALLGWGGIVAAAAGTAAVLDVADAAPSLGLSFAWIAALSSVVGLAMVDLRPADFDAQRSLTLGTWALAGGAALVGGVGGVVVGNVLPLARPAVWLVDIGAAAGALAGFGVAVAGRAGSPLLGWGATLTGTLVGASGGLWAAHALTASASGDVQSFSPIARLVPTLVPPSSSQPPAPGVGVVVALP